MMIPLDRSMRKISTDEPPDRFQIDLFWKRSPHLIITIYQYMSFLYAFGGGFLALFASDIDGDFAIAVTAITFSISYLLNLFLVSYFMPRFTLCVSVGQLTDRATLNESLAEYRLKKVRACEERSDNLDVYKKITLPLRLASLVAAVTSLLLTPVAAHGEKQEGDSEEGEIRRNPQARGALHRQARAQNL